MNKENGIVETRMVVQKTTGESNLGRSIRVGSKTLVEVSEPGVLLEFNVPSVYFSIGIGEDHTAHVHMTEEAWEALKDDYNDVTIDTLQDKIKRLKDGRKK